MLAVRILFVLLICGGVFVASGVADPTCVSPMSPTGVDFKMVVEICNASSSIPVECLTQFNRTGVLPSESDKIGMCFMRCLFEISGVIKDWKLNKEFLHQKWPLRDDSIEFCEGEGKSESDDCVRFFAVAKCLIYRGIMDAGSA